MSEKSVLLKEFPNSVMPYYFFSEKVDKTKKAKSYLTLDPHGNPATVTFFLLTAPQSTWPYPVQVGRRKEGGDVKFKNSITYEKRSVEICKKYLN